MQVVCSCADDPREYAYQRHLQGPFAEGGLSQVLPGETACFVLLRELNSEPVGGTKCGLI